ncbi:MAG TPA: CYTH domain-containing protein [Verrucomicrobiae bacterium]|nr:CYTH domain-containing protein [Verrucomicrobiae bacterium]
MAKEIERKFILPALPAITFENGVSMIQGYVPIPNGQLAMRVRDEGGKKVLTFKSSGTSVRYEANINMDEHPEIFDLLVESTNGAVRKFRYAIPDGDGHCELDVYSGDHPTLEGKISVEREFPSEEASAAWTPPQWMVDAGAIEVTGDEHYLNSNLLTNGWPAN